MENWRPKEGWAHQRSKYFESHQPKMPYGKTRQADYEAGADAMHRADVEWLEKENEVITYSKSERGHIVTLEFTAENWQAFIGEQ